MYLVCVCVCVYAWNTHGTCVEAREQRSEVHSLPFCGFQGSKAGFQAFNTLAFLH